MFKTVNTSIRPSLESRYPNVRFIFRQQIQPWHPSSTLCHEAGAAVLRLAPEKFWPFSAALFEAQKEFFDVNVVNETRNTTYERLAKVAAKVDVDEGKIFELLKVPDQPAKDGSLNVGNEVTNDIKFMVKVSGWSIDHSVVSELVLTESEKAARVTGVHVSPTVLFNVSSFYLKTRFMYEDMKG